MFAAITLMMCGSCCNRCQGQDRDGCPSAGSSVALASRCRARRLRATPWQLSAIMVRRRPPAPVEVLRALAPGPSAPRCSRSMNLDRSGNQSFLVQPGSKQRVANLERNPVSSTSTNALRSLGPGSIIERRNPWVTSEQLVGDVPWASQLQRRDARRKCVVIKCAARFHFVRAAGRLVHHAAGRGLGWRLQSRHSNRRGRVRSASARAPPGSGTNEAAGQRRLNRNVAQLASSANAF